MLVLLSFLISRIIIRSGLRISHSKVFSSDFLGLRESTSSTFYVMYVQYGKQYVWIFDTLLYANSSFGRQTKSDLWKRAYRCVFYRGKSFIWKKSLTHLSLVLNWGFSWLCCWILWYPIRGTIKHIYILYSEPIL